MILFMWFLCLQLPQVDASGQDPGGRRFRIENGDSLGEKEEVIHLICTFTVDVC